MVTDFFDETKLPKRVRKLLGKSDQVPVLAEINYHGLVGGGVLVVASWIN